MLSKERHQTATGPGRLAGYEDEVEPLRPIFTDPHHIAAAAEANNADRFDHALDAWQMIGERPHLAWLTRGNLVRVGNRCP